MADAPLLLIHGGLGEPMDAQRFWVGPGIVDDLEHAGFRVAAPDRSTSPDSWSAAAAEMAAHLDEPAVVVAASNGCSVGLRLALDHPSSVRHLLLLWPATGDHPRIDAHLPDEVRHLCSGTTIRGVDDIELSTLDCPVVVMSSKPENPVHQRRTVDRLLELLTHAVELSPGCPEPPNPAFAPQREEFIQRLLPHLP